MKILFRLLAIAALVALGWWLWTVFFPNDEAVIRKRLNRLAELLTFDSSEGTIGRVTRVEEAANLFDPNVSIIIDVPTQSRQVIEGRAELRQQALGVRMSTKGLNVRFLDLVVSVEPKADEAIVLLTGEAQIPGDRDLFLQELKFFLRKVEGKWLIYRVETVRTLT